MVNNKTKTKMKQTPKLKCLLLGLLLTGSLLHADTFYLLSRERGRLTRKPPMLSMGYPMNPLPKATYHLVMDGIWLVEDEPTVKDQLTVTEINYLLAERIKAHWEAAAAAALTNAVIPPEPRPGAKSWYSQTEDFVWIPEYLEKTHPGIRTNFRPEQLTRPPEPPTTFKAKRLPPNLRKSSPTYREDMDKFIQQLKQDREEKAKSLLSEPLAVPLSEPMPEPLSVPMPKPMPEPESLLTPGSNTFSGVLYYDLILTPLIAPTAQDYPTLDGTNWSWPDYKPAIVTWTLDDHGTNIEHSVTNTIAPQDIVLVESSKTSFQVVVTYADVIAREINDFNCARLNFYGLCESDREFDVTNYMVMPLQHVTVGYTVIPSPSCAWDNTYLYCNRYMYLAPTHEIFDWPIKYPVLFPPLPTPLYRMLTLTESESPTVTLVLAGQAWGNFHVQCVSNLMDTNWVTATNMATDITGYFETTLPFSSDTEQQYFRVLGY